MERSYQINALTKNLKSLEQNLDRQGRAIGGHNGGESSSQEHAKTVSSLEFLSAEYEELHRFCVTARKELSKLSTQLSELADRVDTIRVTVEELQCHSYQFNVKILGVPKTSPRETVRHQPYVRQALPVHGSGDCHASRHRHRSPSPA